MNAATANGGTIEQRVAESDRQVVRLWTAAFAVTAVQAAVDAYSRFLHPTTAWFVAGALLALAALGLTGAAIRALRSAPVRWPLLRPLDAMPEMPGWLLVLGAVGALGQAAMLTARVVSWL